MHRKIVGIRLQRDTFPSALFSDGTSLIFHHFRFHNELREELNHRPKSSITQLGTDQIQNRSKLGS